MHKDKAEPEDIYCISNRKDEWQVVRLTYVVVMRQKRRRIKSSHSIDPPASPNCHDSCDTDLRHYISCTPLLKMQNHKTLPGNGMMWEWWGG